MRKNDRLHNIWYLMNYRCNREDYKYGHYIEDHIQVCPDWHIDNPQGFDNFKQWALAHGYNDNLSIDRIDNMQGYSADNCRWVTHEEQCNNRRTNIQIEHHGKTMTAAQWAREQNIKEPTLRHRLKTMSVEQALTMPVHSEFNAPYERARRYSVNGECGTLRELSEKFGVKPDTVRKRMQKGMTIEQAIGV